MRKAINKLQKKIVPVIERTVKWIIKTSFELLKLAGLGYMTMSLISAPRCVEIAIALIVVFAAYHFTNRK